MHFTIRKVDDYLRADIYDRETADETRQFLDALRAEADRLQCRKGLICNHHSRAIFRVETFALSRYFERLTALPEHRLALVADNGPVRSAHQYIETLAQQKRLNVRAFRMEDEALRWLRGEPTRESS